MRPLLLLILFILNACTENIGQRGTTDRTEIIRLADSDVRSLDPHIASDLASLRVAADQFEGLTRFAANGEPEAGLAQSWSVSADGKLWRFTMRENLFFSDSTPITPDIFSQNLARIRDSQTASPHVALFDVIESIRPEPDNIVNIRLKTPFPQLPHLLAHPAMAALPFHIINVKGDKWTSQRPMVTSGAYQLTDWRLAQQITLNTNPKWHSGAPQTASILWKPAENAQTAMRQILAGEADIASNFPASRLLWLKENYPDILKVSDYLGSYYFVFNTRNPPFDNRDVRMALSMSVNRQWIAEKMIAAGNVAANSVVPASLLADQTTKPAWASLPMKDRLVKARQLLKKAGYDANNPLTFEIRFNSSPEHRRVAVAISTMWREIGVEARLLNSEASLHFDALRRGDFELSRSGWVADIPAAENFLAIHRSNAGTQNYTGYANPAFDRALDIANQKADPTERARAMRKAENILLQDMPLLPLYFYTSRNLVQSDISGWVDNPANIHPSRFLGRTNK